MDSHTTKRVSRVFHVDDLLLTGTHQIITEVLTELSRDLELKSSEVTTKPTRYLGRTLVKTKEEYNFEFRPKDVWTSSDRSVPQHTYTSFRMWKACWRSSTCPRSRAHQHCDGNAARQMRRRCLQANKESTDSLLENCSGLTELTCSVRR